MKVNNFSAGPSKIPDTVVNQISKDILDYQKLGYSVLEISHRSKVFEEILAKVKSHLYELLKIPENFDIFFLQGGATFQNTFIPANKPSLIDNLLFLISGTWGKKTFQDFERYNNQNFPSIPLNDETYDELKTRLDAVLSGTVKVGNVADEIDDAPVAAPKVDTKPTTTKVETPVVEEDDTLDDF